MADLLSGLFSFLGARLPKVAPTVPTRVNGHSHDSALQLAERTAREIVGSGELGASGTQFFSGFIDSPEFNSKLEGKSGSAVYRQMLADPQVQAAESVVALPVRSATWAIACDDATIKAELEEQFFHRLNWDRFLRHALMAFSYGFEVMEKVVIEDGGKYWYSRLAHRGQDTIERWYPHKDDADKIGYIQQLVWKDGQNSRPEIPGDKLFHLAWDQEGNAFTGRSGLRSAYKPWFIKENIERVNAIAFERFGLGVPTWEMPEKYSSNDVTAAKESARSFRAGEKAFVIVPPGWKFSITGHAAGDRLDPLPYIRYCDEMIATSVLAMALVLGRTESGSRALAEPLLDLFMVALQSVANMVASGVNEQLIKPWLMWNYPNGAEIEATMEWSNLQLQNIGFISEALSKLGSTGFVRPGAQTEKTLRDWMRLPEDEEVYPPMPVAQPFQAVEHDHGHVKAAESLYWRELRPEEKHIALREIAGRQDDARDQIAETFREQRGAWIDSIVEQLREAMADGDYSDVSDVEIPKALREAPRKEIVATLRDTHRFGRRTVQDEASRQKRKLRDDPPESKEVSNLFFARAARYLKGLASRLEALASERAIGILRAKGDQDLEDSDFEAIAENLTEALDATALNDATVMVAEALNLGRSDAMVTRKDEIGSAIYSAILDSNVCGECLSDDGKEVELGGTEYYDLMPPNKACESVKSGSNRCRCIFIGVFEGAA